MKAAFWVLVQVIIIIMGSSISSSENSRRFPRIPPPSIPSDQSFQLFADRMAMMSRVVTSLGLKIGLMDGTTPVDRVIFELLGFELPIGEEETGEKLEDVVGRILKRMDEMLDRQKPEITNVEKEIVEWHTVQKTWTAIRKRGEMPDADDFKAILELKRLKFPVTLGNLKIVRTAEIAKLEALGKDVNANEKALRKALKPLETAILEVKKERADVAIAGIRKTLERMTTFDAFVKMMYTDYKATTFIARFNETRLQEVSRDLKAFEDVGASNASSSAFRVLNDTLQARRRWPSMSRHPIERIYTSGLVNGFRDLAALADDVTDAWLLKVLLAGGAKQVADGVVTLSEFKTSMEQLEHEWAALDVDLEGVAHVIRLHERLLALRPPAEDVTTPVLKKLKACKVPAKHFEVRTPLDMMRTVIRKVKALAAIIDFLPPTELEQMLKVCSGSFENLPKLIALLRRMTSHVAILSDAVNLKKAIDAQLELQPDIREPTLIDNHLEFLDCIQKALTSGDEAKHVVELADVSKLMRTVKTRKSIANSSRLVDDVAAFRPAFDEIRGVAARIRAESASQLGELIHLKDVQTVSKTLGDATTVVVMIQKTSEYRAEFERFLKDGEGVRERIAKIGDVKKRAEIQKMWGDFERDAEKVRRMLRGIEERTTKKTFGTSSGHLTEYGPHFESLAGLESVRIDWEAKIEAVKLLNVNQPLGELKKALEDVALLDLEFARFDGALVEVTGALRKLSQVFAGFDGDGSDDEDEWDDEGGEEPAVKEMQDMTWFLWLMLVLAIPIGSSHLAVTLFKQRFRNRTKTESQKRSGKPGTKTKRK